MYCRTENYQVVNNEFVSRLTNSDAVSSLYLEKQVYDHLVYNKWDTIRSPYYIDAASNKSREIDVVASRSYEGLSKRDVALLLEMKLVIECKTLSGYHIIVDGPLKMKKSDIERHQDFWIGYELGGASPRVGEILDRSGLLPIEREDELKRITKLLYPEGRSIYSDFTARPREVKRYSVFRETNIGSTKEIDNSVVWKAFLALNSASEGFKTFQWQRIESDLLYHYKYQKKTNRDLKKFANSLFFQVINKFISLHKILVVDADLWLTGRQLKPIPHFRFIQSNLYGSKVNSIDVVNVKHFETYIKLISDYYEDFYKKTNLVRSTH